MSAYVVVQVHVHDTEIYEKYKSLAPASIAAHGGRYLVRGGATKTLEGTWRPARLVILEFPSVAQAEDWWSSVDYAEAKGLRQSCASTELLVVPGVT